MQSDFKLCLRQLGKLKDLELIEIKEQCPSKYVYTELGKNILFLQNINNQFIFYNKGVKKDFCEFKIDLSKINLIKYKNKKYYELKFITQNNQTLFIRYQSIKNNKVYLIYKFDF